MSPNRFWNHYTAKRDTRLRYGYEATWLREGSLLNWQARVLRNGVIKGTPTGALLMKFGAMRGDDEALVKAAVERSIETLSGVES